MNVKGKYGLAHPKNLTSFHPLRRDAKWLHLDLFFMRASGSEVVPG
jgi:hypothetical protein